MAETFERLGIQLELDNQIKGDPTQVLANLKKTLEGIAQVLKGIDLSKLGKVNTAATKKGLDDTLKSATALKEVLSSAVSIKPVGNAFSNSVSDINKITDAAKKLNEELKKASTFGPKISPVPLPNTDAFLKATQQKKLANGQVEYFQPKASPVGANDLPEIMKVIQRAWKQGYAMEDYSLQNFGKVGGKVFGIDADAFTPKAQASVSSLKELQQMATRFIQNEAGINNIAEAISNVGVRANLAAQSLQKVGSTWKEFLVANKEVALAKTGNDWEKAQRLMSDFYQNWKREAKEAAAEAKKATAEVSNTSNNKGKNKSALADSIKQEEQNNRVRAEIIRTSQKLEDDYLAKQVKNAEAQAAIRRKIAEAQAKDAEAEVKREEARLNRLQGISERRDLELAKLRGKALADQQSIYDKQAITAIASGSASSWNPSTTRKSTYITDVGQAQTLAINEQISRTLDTLRAKSIDTKLSADQLAASFRQNGIEISKLDDKQILALQTGVKKLGFDLKSTEGGFVAIKQEVITFGDILRSMFKRLVEFYSIRTVLFAVSGQFREAITASLRFSQNVADIGAIAGSSRREMDELGQSILVIARNSRFTADEVAKLVQLLAQAGVASADLPAVAESTGRFATATGSTPDLAADLVTTSMNVFDKKAEDTAEITNVLTAALNESKLTTQGLATAFNYLAPQAEQLGMSLEQTAGIVATMAQAGIKSSTIGTGTSQLLKVLAAPKGQLKELMEYYSIKPEDIDPMKKSFAEIVSVFENATGKMGEEGVKVQHIMRAMETRTGRALVTAMSLGAEAFERMTTSITGTNAAWVAYYKSMEGAEAKLNVVKQNFQAAIINTFQAASPVLNAAASALIGVTNALNTTFGQITIGLVGLGVLTTGFIALSAAIKTSTAALAAWTAIKSTWLVTLVAANPVIAGIVGGLALLGLGVAGYIKSTNDAAKSAENFNKELFKNMEAVDKSAAGIRNAKQVLENGKEQYVLNEYEKAVKKYGETSKEVDKIRQKGVKVTNDTLISLNKLKAQYPAYFADLKIEGGVVTGLIEGYERLNKARQLKDQETKDKYNTEFGPELKRRAQALAAAESEKARTTKSSIFDLSQGKAGIAFRERKVTTAKKEYEDYLAKLQPTIDYLSGENTPNVEIIPAGASTVGVVSSFGGKLNRTTKDEPSVKPIPSKYDRNGGAGTDTQYNSSKVILENLRLEREEILTRVKTIYQTADELEAAFKRIEQIDKEYADASGEKAKQDVIANAKNIIKKEGQAKYDEYLRNAEELDNKKLAQLKAKQIKERQEIDKLQQQHELEIVRIEQDAQRKANEARIANLTKQITSAYTGDADRAKFVVQALGLTEANIDAEIDKQIADLTEKQRQAAERLDYTGIGRYQNQINNLNYDTRSDMKAEASKALNQQAVQGIQAAEEKALQLEQQKLAVVEKQIAARKDNAWGADAVNALDIERLEAAKKAAQEERRIVLEKQAQIPAGELTNELADKYKTKLDGIAEKEKEITREIQKRNQGALGNFVDGMQEAWNRISDVNAATKELGSNLTNTFVNGIGTTLSNTFSTAFFPDQGKINEIQTKINELRTQKADLEGNIGTIERNTDKTPEEIKNLNDYKTKLDEVNGALRQQEEAVRKQKDAWSSFASGLKEVMKEILKELQNYIIKLIAVWVVQKLVGLAFNAFGGDSALAGAEQGSFSETALLGMKNFSGAGGNTGGLFTGKKFITGYQEGGIVNGLPGGYLPESMGTPGKDSILAMLAPGEVVINREAVQHYSAEKLLALNQKKIAKFAEGGLVGGGATGSSTNANNSKEYNLQIVNITQNDQIPSPDQQATQIINVINADLARRGPTYKNFKAAMAN